VTPTTAAVGSAAATGAGLSTGAILGIVGGGAAAIAGAAVAAGAGASGAGADGSTSPVPLVLMLAGDWVGETSRGCLISRPDFSRISFIVLPDNARVALGNVCIRFTDCQDGTESRVSARPSAGATSQFTVPITNGEFQLGISGFVLRGSFASDSTASGTIEFSETMPPALGLPGCINRVSDSWTAQKR